MKSKHKFVKMLMQDEEILFWNESASTFVLTNKRFLVHGVEWRGAHKTGIKRHDYIFPIHTISTIHCTPITFKIFRKEDTKDCLTVEASGKTHTFPFAPGKDQFRNKNKQNKREIIENIRHKFTEMQNKKLTEKYKVEDSELARKISSGNFPDYETYRRASQEGIQEYSDYLNSQDEKQKRENNLDKLMKKVDRIHKDEFMAVMGFSESKHFMDWFMSLPEDSPIILKGEIIYFKSQVPPLTIQGTQKVQRKSFFCQLDNEQHSATESAYECEKCSRTVCADCYDQSRAVGVVKCPYCNGDLHQVQ